MSTKEASKHPGLCPVKRQKFGLCNWTRARNQLPSLSLGTPPHYHMLVFYPAVYLSLYILPGNPQARFRSHTLVDSIVPSQLVGNFISSQPRKSRDRDTEGLNVNTKATRN